MAVVGNAKNARLTIKPVYHWDENTENGWYLFDVSIRGQQYTFYRGDTWFNQKTIIQKGSTVLASQFLRYTPSDTIVIEAIDGALKLYVNGVLALSVVDSTYLVAGDWELREGTLISFENLDAPAPPTTLPLYIGTNQIKKVYIGSDEIVSRYIGTTKIW